MIKQQTCKEELWYQLQPNENPSQGVSLKC